MSDAVEEAILATLKAFALAVPSFAAWLARAIAGQEDRFSQRVADILPEYAPIHAARDKLLGKPTP